MTKKETELLSIAAQKNAIRIIISKQKLIICNRIVSVDYVEKKMKWLISKCSKIARKEYKTRYDWMGKGIYWELCQRLKFDHTNKPESDLKNEIHKILRDFETQTDHLILTRRLGLNKKKELVIKWILLFQLTTEWK